MRRGVACCALLLAVSIPPSTATSTGQTKSQRRLPALTARFPRGFERGLSLHRNAAVNLDDRQPSNQNERRRGTAGGARLKTRARPAGLVQSCFLQPCSSAPVVRERAGRKAGLSTREQPERSAMRCRHRAKPPTAKRRSGDDEESEHEGNGEGHGDGARPRNGGAPMPRMVSWGLNSRSQPSARKALGSSSKTHTTVHVCEVCGSEHVQWVGRCPTCKEWNCVKPFKVRREQGANPSRISRPGGGVGVGGGGGSGADPEFGGLGGGAFGGGVGWLPDQGFAAPTRLSDVGEVESQKRLPLPGSELPRVLGGGLVPGSMVMLGGDPGVGKSTLLLQLAGQLASYQPRHGFSSTTSSMGGESNIDDDDDDDDDYEGLASAGVAAREGGEGDDSDPFRTGTVVYVSGEENNSQVAARAGRMGISGVDLFLYCETDIDIIIDQMLIMEPRPALVMVDSIQTMRTGDSTSSPGSVTQVKECASRLVRLAKGSGITVFIVGHVTKSGTIAGPKVVEHMVDTVLYLEGDRFNSYRLLRSVKNRFGPSNEIGVFEMEAGGLLDVADPSMLFLSTKHMDGEGGVDEKDMDGSAVCVYMEGSRPILCELQSLVTYSRLPSPRRTSDGLQIPRLLLLLAVLQKRLGYDMSSREVYLNIVGGLKVQETAADLAVALAVVSSYTSIPVRSDTCFIGEIGLGGELRPVQQLPRRIQEAETFGFSRVVVPFTRKNRSEGGRKARGTGKGLSATAKSATPGGGGGRGKIEVVECRNLKDAVAAGLTSVPKKRSYSGNKRSSYSNKSRGGEAYGSEPEFGWRPKKQRGLGSTGAVDAASEVGTARERGDNSGDEFDGYDVEGMEGGWGGLGGDGFGEGGQERPRGRGKSGVEEDEDEWEGPDE